MPHLVAVVEVLVSGWAGELRQLLGGGGAEQLLALLPLDLVHHLRQTLQDRTMSNGYFRFSILKLASPD